MRIQEALDLFSKLLANATEKRDIKNYKNFVQLLAGLGRMKLTPEQQEKIATYLDGLQLKVNSDRGRKYFSKKYQQFTTYLQSTFGFVTEGYYASMGIGLGLSLGAGLGITFGSIFGGTGVSMGISFGAGIGMVLGMLVGNHLDKEAKINGKVISTPKD